MGGPLPAVVIAVAPAAVLASASAHELLYNHAGWPAWLLAQGLAWSLVLRGSHLRPCCW